MTRPKPFWICAILAAIVLAGCGEEKDINRCIVGQVKTLHDDLESGTDVARRGPEYLMTWCVRIVRTHGLRPLDADIYTPEGMER